jgi:hypothetical protein
MHVPLTNSETHVLRERQRPSAVPLAQDSVPVGCGNASNIGAGQDQKICNPIRTAGAGKRVQVAGIHRGEIGATR